MGSAMNEKRNKRKPRSRWKLKLKITMFTLILATVFRLLFEKIPYVQQNYIAALTDGKLWMRYLVGSYSMVLLALVLFFLLKKERTWGNLICIALLPIAYIWSMVLFHAVAVFLICFAAFSLLDVWLEKMYYEDVVEEGILEYEPDYDGEDPYDAREIKDFINGKCVKVFFRQFFPNQAKALLWMAFFVLVYVSASDPSWFKGKVVEPEKAAVSTGQRLGYTEETAKEIVIATNTRDYLSSEESYHWEDNKETLVKLHKDIWVTLSFEERLDLLQELLNLECAYLGVESCQLIAEDIKQFNLAGYYWEANHYIAIEKEYVNRARSQEAIWIILHESYHIFQHRAVENYEKIKDSEEVNSNLYFYRDCEKWAQEMRHYKSCDSVEDFAEVYQYKSQAMETSAEDYAGKWISEYIDFAAKTYDELYGLPDLTQDGENTTDL